MPDNVPIVLITLFHLFLMSYILSYSFKDEKKYSLESLRNLHKVSDQALEPELN